MFFDRIDRARRVDERRTRAYANSDAERLRNHFP
jgi:hypothetical protein